jgi:hypothetical protein
MNEAKELVLDTLRGASDEDFGDALVEVMIEYWKAQGHSDDDILFVVETALKEE